MHKLTSTSESVFIEELTDFTPNFLILAVFFWGGVNLNLAGTNPNSQIYLNLMYKNGFHSLINVPTQTVHSNTCIDHIFVNHKHLHILQSAVIDYGLTTILNKARNITIIL